MPMGMGKGTNRENLGEKGMGMRQEREGNKDGEGEMGT